MVWLVEQTKPNKRALGWCICPSIMMESVLRCLTSLLFVHGVKAMRKEPVSEWRLCPTTANPRHS